MQNKKYILAADKPRKKQSFSNASMAGLMRLLAETHAVTPGCINWYRSDNQR